MAVDDFELFMKFDELIRVTERVADAVEGTQRELEALQSDVASIRF